MIVDKKLKTLLSAVSARSKQYAQTFIISGPQKLLQMVASSGSGAPHHQELFYTIITIDWTNE
jgi:hypothetical protein